LDIPPELEPDFLDWFSQVGKDFPTVRGNFTEKRRLLIVGALSKSLNLIRPTLGLQGQEFLAGYERVIDFYKTVDPFHILNSGLNDQINLLSIMTGSDRIGWMRRKDPRIEGGRPVRRLLLYQFVPGLLCHSITRTGKPNWTFIENWLSKYITEKSVPSVRHWWVNEMSRLLRRVAKDSSWPKGTLEIMRKLSICDSITAYFHWKKKKLRKLNNRREFFHPANQRLSAEELSYARTALKKFPMIESFLFWWVPNSQYELVFGREYAHPRHDFRCYWCMVETQRILSSDSTP